MTCKRILQSAVALLTLCWCGCAVMLTIAMPPEKTTRPGESLVGEAISYNYTLEENSQGYTLVKSPLCREKVEEIQRTRKRPRGIIAAIVELPLYGLGAVDWLFATMISKGTVSYEKIGERYTGELVECGEPQPAAEENLVFQFSESEIIRYLQTDQQAVLALNGLLENMDEETQVNIFVKNKGEITYITTLERSDWQKGRNGAQ